MPLRDQIKETPEYQQFAGQKDQQGETSTTSSTPTGQGQQPQAVMVSLDPLLDWEKNDLEFWVQVAQLVVLLAIFYRLGRGR